MRAHTLLRSGSEPRSTPRTQLRHENILLAYYVVLVKLKLLSDMLSMWSYLLNVLSVFILDNADNLELFGVGCTEGTNESLSSYIPRGPQGTILWTTP